jgi:hypothetical protein
MTELKIMLQTPGLALFDPAVLQAFIDEHQVALPNVLQSFIDDPGLGNEAIAEGCLLTVYSIQPWDYHVLITAADKSTVPADWVLFETPTFVLQIASQRLIAADIWAIMNWDAAAYQQAGPQPIDEKYATANAFKASDLAEVPNGRYQVKIVGFCDLQNPDLENRKCGYEFLLVPNEHAVPGVIGSIDNLDLDVVRLRA